MPPLLQLLLHLPPDGANPSKASDKWGTSCNDFLSAKDMALPVPAWSLLLTGIMKGLKLLSAVQIDLQQSPILEVQPLSFDKCHHCRLLVYCQLTLQELWILKSLLDGMLLEVNVPCTTDFLSGTTRSTLDYTSFKWMVCKMRVVFLKVFQLILQSHHKLLIRNFLMIAAHSTKPCAIQA